MVNIVSVRLAPGQRAAVLLRAINLSCSAQCICCLPVAGEAGLLSSPSPLARGCLSVGISSRTILPADKCGGASLAGLRPKLVCFLHAFAKDTILQHDSAYRGGLRASQICHSPKHSGVRPGFHLHAYEKADLDLDSRCKLRRVTQLLLWASVFSTCRNEGASSIYPMTFL